MIEFRLCLCVNDEEEKFFEGFILRTFKMPSLPRIGELIEIAEDSYEIYAVYHCLEEGISEVRCMCLLFEFCNAFLSCDGWTLTGFSEEDEKKFKKAVKERRKQKERVA